MIVYANNLVTMRTYISTVYATSIAVNYFLAYDGEKKNIEIMRRSLLK